MNWNQVSCGPCWVRNNPGRGNPARALNADQGPSETCSWCGEQTNSGIYVRANPNEVPFPQPEDE